MNNKQPIITWGKYPFLSLLVALIIGILISYYSLFASLVWIGVGIVAVALIILIWLWFLPSIKNTYQIFNSILIFLCVVGLGIILGFKQDIRNDLHWYGHNLKGSEALLVKVDEAPVEKDKIVSIPVKVLAVKDSVGWIKTKGSVYLHFFKYTYNHKLNIGDELLIPNEMDTITNSNNPFSFKYGDYLKLQNIYHQIFLPQEHAKILEGNNKLKPSSLINASNKIHNVIEKNVKDSVTASIMYATILNDRSSLDPDLWKIYSKTGIAHIIAISGMHISIFFGIIFLMLMWIRNRKLSWVRYAIAIPIVWAYIAITGFPASAVRAGVMFTLLSIGVFIGRKGNNVNTLFATAFLLLIYKPFWIFDVGFQLSFLSVLSIFLFYTKIFDWVKVENKILKFLWGTVAVSLSVQILLMPLIVYYFHQFPLFGILANIPASIYSMVLMFLGLMIIIFGYIGINMIWMGDLLAWITHWFHKIIQFFADISPNFFYELYLDKMGFWLSIILVSFLAIFWITKKKWTLFGGLAMCILFLTLTVFNQYHSLQQEKLIIYQVNNKLVIMDVKGKLAKLYSSDVLNEKDQTYSIMPTKIGLGLSEIQEDYDNNIWNIKGKKVAIVKGNLKVNATPFPVDYLILQQAKFIDPELILKTFQPKKVILSTSLKRYQVENFGELLAAQNIPYWNVYKQGAFVIE